MKFLFKLLKLKAEYKIKSYTKFFEYAYDVVRWALDCDFKKGN